MPSERPSETDMHGEEPQDERDRPIIDAILAGGVKIPPMPAVMLELTALQRDEDAGPAQYAALIGRDAALSGALFRVAGSPVFGLRAKPETLVKAITVLGLRTTNAVTHGESLRHVMDDPAQVAVMNALWQHLQAVAELLLRIMKAARPRGVSQDQAYLLGLFHDCGVAILAKRFPGYGQALIASPVWPDLTALDRQFQTSHGVVGQMVARNWQLPADLVLAIRHHHDPAMDGLPEDVRRLITLLRFALHLRERQLGRGEDGEWPAWREQVLALLNLDAPELEDLADEVLAAGTAG